MVSAQDETGETQVAGVIAAGENVGGWSRRGDRRSSRKTPRPGSPATRRSRANASARASWRIPAPSQRTPRPILRCRRPCRFHHRQRRQQHDHRDRARPEQRRQGDLRVRRARAWRPEQRRHLFRGQRDRQFVPVGGNQRRSGDRAVERADGDGHGTGGGAVHRRRRALDPVRQIQQRGHADGAVRRSRHGDPERASSLPPSAPTTCRTPARGRRARATRR